MIKTALKSHSKIILTFSPELKNPPLSELADLFLVYSWKLAQKVTRETLGQEGGVNLGLGCRELSGTAKSDDHGLSKGTISLIYVITT